MKKMNHRLKKLGRLMLQGAFVLFIITAVVSCSGGSNGEDKFSLPEEFKTYNIAQKMQYVMEHESPKAVAHFIYNAALGKIEGVDLSIGEATVYAYTHYDDAQQKEFAKEFDDYGTKLSKEEKMKMYYLAGQLDAFKLGYLFGQDYVNADANNKAQMKGEMSEFKNACGTDTATYDKFKAGLRYYMESNGKEAMLNEL